MKFHNKTNISHACPCTHIISCPPSLYKVSTIYFGQLFNPKNTFARLDYKTVAYDMQKNRRKHNLDTMAHQTHNYITVSPRHYSKPVLTGFICWAGYNEIRIGESAYVINVRAVSSHYLITRTWLSSEKNSTLIKIKICVKYRWILKKLS